MSEVVVDRFLGSPGDAGVGCGRTLREIGLFDKGFLDRYYAAFCETNRVELGDLRDQARRWLTELPGNFQEEIDGIGVGGGIGTDEAAAFLFADIAKPTRGVAATSGIDREELAGPMCSAVTMRLNGGGPWVARNCDWLRPLLMRGTAATVHRCPGRIPVVAFGIRGDIDIDTGMNAERLWLHLHTFDGSRIGGVDRNESGDQRPRISWLFWAREALETCATIDEVERFVRSTRRDRGVIAVVVDGKSDEGAIFECSRDDHRRFDLDGSGDRCFGGGPMFATNHAIDKEVSAERESKARAGSTVGRWCGLRRSLRDHPPEHGPDDLIELLGDESVEMRDPVWLRTIYSTVCEPASGAVWFSAGTPEGNPAASGGRWSRVVSPF